MGVYAQICYQNSGVTQAGSLMSLGDNDLALTIIKIYNDAAAERQEESGQRLFTLAHLPLWDKAAMEAEARRCLDMGLKGFVLPDTPERLRIPSFLHDYWTPLLEMCCRPRRADQLPPECGDRSQRADLGRLRVRADAVRRRDDVLDRQCGDAWQLDRQRPARSSSQAQDRPHRKRHGLGARSRSKRSSISSTKCCPASRRCCSAGRGTISATTSG